MKRKIHYLGDTRVMMKIKMQAEGRFITEVSVLLSQLLLLCHY